MKKTFIYNAVMLALASSAFSVNAQNVNSGDKQVLGNQLEAISVIGNQVNSIDTSLSNVTTIPLGNLHDPDVTNLRTALSNNPSIEISATGENVLDKQQIRIRGLGENYVEMTIDGEPAPVLSKSGRSLFGSRNMIETDTLKQIDVIKGRQSVKQNSGALAGTVNMETYSPKDLVDSSKPYYFSAKTGYTSRNEGTGTTITAAGKHNNFSGLAIYTYRDFHEVDNFTEKNLNQFKENSHQKNILVKGQMDFNNGYVLLTGEHFDLSQHITQSKNTDASPFILPTKRNRLSLKTELSDILGLDKVSTKLYWFNYKQSRGHSDDVIAPRVKQNQIGFKFGGNKIVTAGNWEHNIMFGSQFDRRKFDYLNQGTAPSQGFSLTATPPKIIPVRTVPVVTRNKFAFYLQDKMSYNSKFSITPGIRIEHQKYDSKKDQAYQNNQAIAVEKDYQPHGSSTYITPIIRADYAFTPETKIYASYAKGNKAADDSNNTAFDHDFIWILPNPNLKDERSDNFELGFNYTKPHQFDFKINGFYSKFKNFIAYDSIGESYGKIMGMYPKSIYRPFNVDKDKVYGVEIESNVVLNDSLSLASKFIWNKKKTTRQMQNHGIPLTTTVPMTALLGLDYHHNEIWGGAINWKVVGKGEKPLDENGNEIPNTFRTPGYGLVDLTAWWKPVKNVTLSGGVYNVFNKKYWLSADVNGKATVQGRRNPKPVNLDKDTQPGRNFALNLKVEF